MRLSPINKKTTLAYNIIQSILNSHICSTKCALLRYVDFFFFLHKLKRYCLAKNIQSIVNNIVRIFIIKFNS